MRTNVIFSAALLAAGALCIAPSVAAVKSPGVVRVRHATTGTIKPMGSAGDFIAPFSTIRAIAQFTDDGTTLTVAGYGVGFTAGLSYTSFFYGNGSFARGTLACLPPTPNNLTVPQMVTAYWLPTTGTTRTLYVKNTGASYTPISSVDAFSVRYDTSPSLGLAALSAANPPTPARFWLNSCGLVRNS